MPTFVANALHVVVNLTVLEPNPPRNLRATATASALALMWDSPASGLVGEFEIQLTNKDGTKRNTGKDTRQTTFTNLVPFTSYTVMVVTVLGNKRSEALKKDFDTSKCVVIRISNHFNE